ncbi:hypothetical protein ACQ4PT_047488 [Festuca glaucescens]
MSCSSSPRDADVDGRRHGGRGKNQAEAEEVPALDLLDDFWFFSNSLGGRDDGRGGTRRPPLLPKSPSTSSAGRAKTGGAHDQLQGNKSRFHDASGGGGRRLLRTPSLPSPPPSSRDVEEEAPGGGGDQAPAEAVEDDDMNWSKIYEGVLRTRIAEEGRGSPPSSALLHRAPSTPVPYSAAMGVDGRGRGEEAVTRSTPSLLRLRHSHSTLENHCRSHTPTKPDRDRTPRMASISSRAERGHPRRNLRSFGATQHPATIARTKSEKWKNSSALESIEVQGFKDLGFVFDQEELRESLADVLPGLKTRGSDNDDANVDGEQAGQDEGPVRRPYLSEAWQHGARSAPPLTASASAMKDQLRMWAQAVACNVRQEC